MFVTIATIIGKIIMQKMTLNDGVIFGNYI